MVRKKKTKNYYNMVIQRINQQTSAFNEIRHYIESDNGKEKVEVWLARELQLLLGYARCENILNFRSTVFKPGWVPRSEPSPAGVWGSAVLGQTIDGLMAFGGLLYSERSAQGEIV